MNSKTKAIIALSAQGHLPSRNTIQLKSNCIKAGSVMQWLLGIPEVSTHLEEVLNNTITELMEAAADRKAQMGASVKGDS